MRRDFDPNDDALSGFGFDFATNHFLPDSLGCEDSAGMSMSEISSLRSWSGINGCVGCLLSQGLRRVPEIVGLEGS